ncbi:unnamed protein product [Lymnaea stagnalis]|uniref:Metalloendopeptidase n=1 Tax=Lymnaea stagnalis TaxID=6523 RepID=A0AAV2IDM5_LYMST
MSHGALAWLVLGLLTIIRSTDGGAPPPNFRRPYETYTNLSMDEAITGMLGGVDVASNMIMADDGKILAELDMYLSEEQFLSMYQPPKADEMYKMGMMPAPVGVAMDENYFFDFAEDYSSRTKRKATRSTTLRWTNSEIPYVFAKGHFGSTTSFDRPAPHTQNGCFNCFDLVSFRPISISIHCSIHSCNSQLGMVGGVQSLNLQAPGCRFKGLYLHEIGHALGLVHEHQLPDRDNYIEILYYNVAPHMRIWFNKYTTREVDQMSVPYEYSSVMHYGITAFASDGNSQTIRAFDRSKEDSIGKVYLKELSYTDVHVTNLMYNCSDHCPDKNKCGPKGHVDQNCNCICADGSKDCDRTRSDKDVKCVNNYNSWACYIWANQGECERNPLYMKEHCKKACGVCGAEPAQQQDMNFMLWPWQWFARITKVMPKKWSNLGGCKDEFSSVKCAVWKQRGDCSTNVGWMKANCRSTCGLCGDSATRPEVNCQNSYKEEQKCDDWAKDGECKVNAKWMFNNCRKSCAMCLEKEEDIDDGSEGGGGGVDWFGVTCENTNDNCEKWAKTGECENNPTWMINNCRQACGKCDDGTCKNFYDDVQCTIWAQKLECLSNSEWMSKHCALACGRGLCESVATLTTPRTTSKSGVAIIVWSIISSPTMSRHYSVVHHRSEICSGLIISSLSIVISGECKNLHRSDTECDIWAKNDHCTINPNWMRKNCRKACQACQGVGVVTTTTKGTRATTDSGKVITVTGDQCNDRDEECASWAQSGYCNTNPRYNLISCKKSCNNCNGCRDAEFLCALWAKDGHCEKNPSYMLRHCQKSCETCTMSRDLEALRPDTGDEVLRPGTGDAASTLMTSLLPYFVPTLFFIVC